MLTERVGGDEHVIAYDSKALTKQQTKWPTYDKELWAVVHAIRRFRQYTTGAKFLIVTDHKPLANIPRSIAVERDGTGRRGRWAVELSSFDFDVLVKAGVDHGNADALSRRPAEPPVSDRSASNETSGYDGEASTSRGTTASAGEPRVALPVADDGVRSPDTGVCPDPGCTAGNSTCAAMGVDTSSVSTGCHDVRQAQERDMTLQRVRKWCERKETPDPEEMGEWRYVLTPCWEQVTVVNGVVGITSGRSFRAAVPKSLRVDVLRLAHDHMTSGHMGQRRTSLRVRQRFIWPGMYKDVRDFCDACGLCQRRHRPTPAKRAPMVTEVTSRPFERIAADITEMPTSIKGNKHALVIMDYFSKYVRIYPIVDQKTETVLECLLDWVHDFGVPCRLHSDQGSQFESRLFQAMCERLGIKKTRTTPYRPESDGMVERFNRTLKDMLSKYIDEQGLDWDANVKAYSMAYNSSVHSATGFTPFFLVHGYEPRVPLDAMLGPPAESIPVRSYLEDRLRAIRAAYEQVRRNSAQAAAKATQHYNKRQCAENYKEGDKVWVRDFRAAAGGKPKLGLPYKGPSTIISRVGSPGREVAYKVQSKDGKVRVVHHNHLKPAKATNDPPTNTDRGRITDPTDLPSGTREDGEGVGRGPWSVAGEKWLKSLLLLERRKEESAPPHGPPNPYRTRSGRVSRPAARYQATI